MLTFGLWQCLGSRSIGSITFCLLDPDSNPSQYLLIVFIQNMRIHGSGSKGKISTKNFLKNLLLSKLNSFLISEWFIKLLLKISEKKIRKKAGFAWKLMVPKHWPPVSSLISIDFELLNNYDYLFTFQQVLELPRGLGILGFGGRIERIVQCVEYSRYLSLYLMVIKLPNFIFNLSRKCRLL